MTKYTRIKKFFHNTRFLWIGGVLGFIQQLMGRLDYFLYKGRDIFSFSAILGGLSIYAMIILLMIFRKNATPKEQIKDIFLFFLGLDFFYYLYIFIMELITFIIIKNSPKYMPHETNYYFQQTFEEIFDFIKWTAIGTAASIWAFFSVKFRNNGKKVKYLLMLAPLFLVITTELITFLISNINFAVQEYKRANNIPLPEGFFYVCTVSSLLTSVVCLCVAISSFHKNHSDYFRAKKTS